MEDTEFLSILENANHFFPKSFSETPKMEYFSIVNNQEKIMTFVEIFYVKITILIIHFFKI